MGFTRGLSPKEAMGIGLYIYDNGFGPRNYVCSNCDSTKLKQMHKGGFQPPFYICQDCGATVHAPKWINL